jgi:hypothetical protein
MVEKQARQHWRRLSAKDQIRGRRSSRGSECARTYPDPLTIFARSPDVDTRTRSGCGAERVCVR